jgi:FKBP-type peptidyl-prolyl cis-trans isomerase SlyD
MITQGSFIHVSYTGYDHQTGAVFDTTDPAVAKSIGHNAQPITICVGQGQLLPKVEDALIGKKALESVDLILSPEDAFGKKDSKLIQLVSLAKFKHEKITPQVGLPVNVNNHTGYIVSVGAGRVLVDFNHPLANKTVRFHVTVLRIVTDVKEQVEAVLSQLRVPATASVTGQDVVLTFSSDLPPHLGEIIEKHIKKVIPSVQKVTCESHAKPTKSA